MEGFTPMFKVFKKERTGNDFITILKKNDEAFDLQAKINFYLNLGYTIKLIK